MFKNYDFSHHEDKKGGKKGGGKKGHHEHHEEGKSIALKLKMHQFEKITL